MKEQVAAKPDPDSDQGDDNSDKDDDETAALWDEIPISWPKVKFLSFIFWSFYVQILFTDSPRTKFRTGQVYTCSRVAWTSVDI